MLRGWAALAEHRPLGVYAQGMPHDACPQRRTMSGASSPATGTAAKDRLGSVRRSPNQKHTSRCIRSRESAAHSGVARAAHVASACRVVQ